MVYKLQAKLREVRGDKSRTVQELPAVIYGAEKDSQALSLSTSEFVKLYEAAGESSLIDLAVDGKEDGKVLVQEVQLDPLSGRIMHVDLRRINMNKPMTATVELHFIGESPAVKASGGTLVRTLEEVEVECLPKDLVSHLDIDLSVLATFDDVVKVKDLRLPEGIQITSPNAEDLVVKATPALTEEEIKKMEEEAAAMDVSKIEDVKEKKVEEGEEGAVPAEGEEKKEEKKDK